MQLSVEIYLKVTENKTIAVRPYFTQTRKYNCHFHDGLIFSVIRSCSILI